MGIECFLPLLREKKIVQRQQRTVIAPLFPCYLFVRVDLREHYRAVMYARGVRKIVEFGSRPAKVDIAVIHAIQDKMSDQNIHVLEGAKELRSGQLVHIKEGPLVGLDAVFVREMPARQRAMILLHTLALRARAEVDIDQLAPYIAA